MKNFILSLFILSFAKIIAVPPPTCQITLTSGSETNSQIVCANTAITNITYSVSGTSASVLGLPNGVSSTPNGNVLTISGAPIISGSYTYTVITTGGCGPDSATGTIGVNELPTAMMQGGNIAICQNTPVQIGFKGAQGTLPYTFTYTKNGTQKTIATTGGSDSATVNDTVNAAGTIVYNLLNVQDAHCTQQLPSSPQTMTVNALPTATITGGGRIGKNIAPPVTFTGSNGLAPYVFIYTINNGNNYTLQSGMNGVGNVSSLIDSAGDYIYSLIKVYDANGCTQLQTGTSGVITGIPSVQENNLILSPNPFNNQLSITTDKASTIKITTSSGIEVYHGKLSMGKSLIDTNTLSSGVYFVIITDEQSTIAKKMVKD